MPSGNLDAPVEAAAPGATPPRSFRWPADYYSAPLSEVRPVFPRGMVIGCGIASAVIVLVLFAGGALFTGSRLDAFMDFVLGTSLNEMRPMYTSDVTAAQKQQLDAEVEQLRAGLRADKVSIVNLQTFLNTMEAAIADKKVTPDEVGKLTKSAHEARVAGTKTAPKPGSKP